MLFYEVERQKLLKRIVDFEAERDRPYVPSKLPVYRKAELKKSPGIINLFRSILP